MEQAKNNKKIGDFAIGKTIGEGTFGKVRAGVHMPSGKRVAIKVLEKYRIKRRDDLDRVHNELKILHSKVDHPNILKLLELHESEDNIYLVTEYIEGKELYQLIVDKERLDPKLCGIYFSQLLDAVSYLHSIGICHRDIKPENVMVYGNSLKLIDFGLSREFGDNPMLSTSCGSPCYAAPEMIKDAKYDCIKTDIWALGVTLYAMIAGHLPFEHENTERLYEMINCDRYEPISSFNHSVEETECKESLDEISQSYILSDETKLNLINGLLEEMLDKNPKKRLPISEINKNLWIQESKCYLNKCKTEYENDEVLVESMGIFFEKDPNEMRRIIAEKEIMSICTFYYLSRRTKAKPNLHTKEKQSFHNKQEAQIKTVSKKNGKSKIKSEEQTHFNSPKKILSSLICNPESNSKKDSLSPFKGPQKSKPSLNFQLSPNQTVLGNKNKSFSTSETKFSSEAKLIMSKNILQEINNKRDNLMLMGEAKSEEKCLIEEEIPEVHEGSFHINHVFESLAATYAFIEKEFKTSKNKELEKERKVPLSHKNKNISNIEFIKNGISEESEEESSEEEKERNKAYLKNHCLIKEKRLKANFLTVSSSNKNEMAPYKFISKYVFEYKGVLARIKILKSLNMFYLDLPPYFVV